MARWRKRDPNFVRCVDMDSELNPSTLFVGRSCKEGRISDIKGRYDKVATRRYERVQNNEYEDKYPQEEHAVAFLNEPASLFKFVGR